MDLITLSRYLQNNPNFSSKPTNIKDEDMEKMYVRYLKSLLPYSIDLEKQKDKFEEIAREEISDAKNNRNKVLLAFNVGSAAKPEIVGFAIVGTYPNARTMSDIYIQEFYIDKPHQRYGEEAIKLISERYYLFDISMFISKKNTNAKAFWEHTMERIGYIEFTRRGLMLPPSDKEMEESKEEPMDFMYWRNKLRIA